MSNDGAQLLRLNDGSGLTVSASPIHASQIAPLDRVREYLADRVCLMRQELGMLRLADGASGRFSSAISVLEIALEQVSQAASKVMDEADAIEAASSMSGKINLASTLMGTVARSHKAPALREMNEESRKELPDATACPSKPR